MNAMFGTEIEEEAGSQIAGTAGGKGVNPTGGKGGSVADRQNRVKISNVKSVLAAVTRIGGLTAETHLALTIAEEEGVLEGERDPAGIRYWSASVLASCINSFVDLIRLTPLEFPVQM